MRTIITVLGLVAVLLCTGCPPQKNYITPVSDTKPLPPAETLLQSLNQNAQRIQSVESRIEIRGEAGSLSGIMSAQQPQNFRMQARLLGQPAVDMGSNSQEFWYWISHADPPALVFCSYTDLASGKARLQFPFQPEWIIETLGMKERNPQGTYKVESKQNTIDLVEQTTSPQGQPVRKVTAFKRVGEDSRRPGIDSREPHEPRYQVDAHYLQDANGKTICSAHLEGVQYDKNSGAVLPQRVVLSWPAQQMQLTMVLEHPVVNAPIDQNRAAALFTRPQLGGIRSIDLAHLHSQPTGYVQQAGGYNNTPYRR